MALNIRHWTCYEEFIFENVPLIKFNNFKFYKLGVETNFQGLKRQLSIKISEKWLNDVSRWRHISETGHGMQKCFFQNISLNIFNNINCDQFVVKTKFKALKRQFSSQITKKWLNDVFKWRHMSDTGYDMKN